MNETTQRRCVDQGEAKDNDGVQGTNIKGMGMEEEVDKKTKNRMPRGKGRPRESAVLKAKDIEHSQYCHIPLRCNDKK